MSEKKEKFQIKTREAVQVETFRGRAHCLNTIDKEAREKSSRLDLVTMPSTRNFLLLNVREASFT